MASKQFLEAVRKTRQTKSLDTILVGNQSPRLPVGVHDVYIKAVDTTDLDKDRFSVIYANTEDKEHKESVFVLSADKSGFGFGFRALLSALFQDTEAFDLVLSEFETGNDRVLEMFTGMKLRVTLDRGKGFIIKATGNETFIAFDPETNEVLTGEFATAKEAREEAEGQGYKPSYIRVTKLEATHTEENTNILQSAIAGSKSSQATGRAPVL